MSLQKKSDESLSSIFKVYTMQHWNISKSFFLWFTGTVPALSSSFLLREALKPKRSQPHVHEEGNAKALADGWFGNTALEKCEKFSYGKWGMFAEILKCGLRAQCPLYLARLSCGKLFSPIRRSLARRMSLYDHSRLIPRRYGDVTLNIQASIPCATRSTIQRSLRFKFCLNWSWDSHFSICYFDLKSGTANLILW